MDYVSPERRERLYEQRRSNVPTKNAATSSWTPERCEQLAELWAAGLSCSQIAAEMGEGLTRNSVIGKVHRLKLPPRKEAHHKSNLRYMRNPPPKPAKKPAKKPIKGFRPGVALPLLPEAMPGDLEALKGDVWAALPNTSPKPLLAVSDDKGCRWPIGEERPYLFCGEDIHRGVYCRSHAAIAFRPAPVKVSTRPVRPVSGMRLLELEGL
jgi:GcrA cell cycle regulator